MHGARHGKQPCPYPLLIATHLCPCLMQVTVTKEETLKGRVAEHVRALEAEVAVLQRLNHRNIVRYLGTGVPQRDAAGGRTPPGRPWMHTSAGRAINCSGCGRGDRGARPLHGTTVLHREGRQGSWHRCAA